MDADLDTLAAALYARIDDVWKDRPELAIWGLSAPRWPGEMLPPSDRRAPVVVVLAGGS